MSEKTRADNHAPTGANATTHSHPTTRHLVLQRKCACGANSGISGECESCASQHTSLQRRATNGVAASGIPTSVDRTLSSPGRGLDTDSRQFMEDRFDRDFSHVRVHDDTEASSSARDVDAHAYTVGSHIVFAEGQYQPHTSGGQHLLAHELAHTIQQEGMQRSGTASLIDQGPEYRRLEHEADAAANAALNRSPLPTLNPSAGPALSRAATDTRDPQEVPPPTRTPQDVDVDWEPIGKTTHRVTPEEGVLGSTRAKPSEEARMDSFIVDPLVVPGSKGPDAIKRYDAMAGKGLQATLSVEKNARSVMWQERPGTTDLQGRWLDSVGWKRKDADSLWEKMGGDKTFPQVGTKTCQMDHIVELQVGGNNDLGNFQALDAKQNQSSGGSIKSQVFGLARAIAADNRLSAPGASQIRLRFARAEARGPSESVPTTCPPTERTCLAVDACAHQNKGVTQSKDDPRLDYVVRAGGVPATLRVKAEEANSPLETDPLNKSAATLIPGLLLKTLHRPPKAGQGAKNAASDTITSRVDDDADSKTRLPISMTGKSGDVKLTVEKEGELKIADKDSHPQLAFTYRYLSPGEITSISIGADRSLEWRGRIHPKISFLGTLEVVYEKGELKIVKGLEKEKLKSPLRGFRLTKAELALVLSPEFKPEGTLGFSAGPEKSPIAEGEIKVSRDDAGLTARGDLEVHVPGVDKAHITVLYQNSLWSGDLTVQSTQIKIPYVESGSITLHVSQETGISAEGKLGLGLPGGNKAEVSLQRKNDKWLYAGSGTFKIPKLDDTKVDVTYDGETLVAKGSTGFTLYSIKGHIEHLTYTAKKGEEDKITGKGTLAVNKGRVTGKIDVELLPTGHFKGEGEVTIRITDTLTAKAGVAIDEKQRVRVKGQIRIEHIELFKGIQGKKNLFEIEKNIPIPGVSIPGVGGVMAKIGGGVDIGYGIGPGALNAVFISAEFNPLEEQTDLDVALGGQLHIPAYAEISGHIKGGIALDAAIAEVAGFLTLTVSLKLDGGLDAKFDGHYAKHRFVVDASAQIAAALILGLGLDATVRAKAGIGALSAETHKTWALKHLEVPTGVDFKLEAPIHYASDEAFKAPSLDTLKFSPPPAIDPSDLLKRIFKAATESTSGG